MQVLFKVVSDGNNISFLLCMTEGYIFLNNTSWEEIQPINNTNDHFKNQSCFSDLLPNFHNLIFIFSFSIQLYYL